MKRKRVFIIGAGFTKATCENAPLGRNLLKFLENTFDNSTFENTGLRSIYGNALIKSIGLGRKASKHYREIVNNFHNNYYSTVFGKPEKIGDIKTDFSSQYDLELLLSLIVFNHEIFNRSDTSYGDTLENDFFQFINWSIMRTLSPEIIKDELLLAERFCQEILNDEDTIITFNYDLLLDLALYKSGLWYPITSKGDYYFCSYWDKGILPTDEKMFQTIIKFAGTRSINFIKIHGSINWYYSENFYDVGVDSEFSRDLAKLFFPENGKCIFNDGLKINNFKFLLRRGFYNNINELCILKPTLGKQYLKFPFSYLTNKSIKHISEATEIFVLGYSFPLYDTLSEIFILSTKPNCKITFVNLGDDTEKLRRRIAKSRTTDYNNIIVYDKGLNNWINNN